MAGQQAQLAQLKKDYDSELATLRSEKEAAKARIDQGNAAATAGYEDKVLAAKGMGGLLSTICLSVFLWCTYKEVQIKCNCGIYPIREFTDLQAHGSTANKLWAVLGDIFTRSVHARLFKFHRKQIGHIGQLTDIDGRLIMADGNYQEDIKAPESLNGKKVLESLGKN